MSHSFPPPHRLKPWWKFRTLKALQADRRHYRSFLTGYNANRAAYGLGPVKYPHWLQRHKVMAVIAGPPIALFVLVFAVAIVGVIADPSSVTTAPAPVAAEVPSAATTTDAAPTSAPPSISTPAPAASAEDTAAAEQARQEAAAAKKAEQKRAAEVKQKVAAEKKADAAAKKKAAAAAEKKADAVAEKKAAAAAKKKETNRRVCLVRCAAGEVPFSKRRMPHPTSAATRTASMISHTSLGTGGTDSPSCSAIESSERETPTPTAIVATAADAVNAHHARRGAPAAMAPANKSAPIGSRPATPRARTAKKKVLTWLPP